MAQALAEKLEQTRPAKERKDCPSATKSAVGRGARDAFVKGKRNRAICPRSQDHKVRESQGK